MDISNYRVASLLVCLCSPGILSILSMIVVGLLKGESKELSSIRGGVPEGTNIESCGFSFTFEQVGCGV